MNVSIGHTTPDGRSAVIHPAGCPCALCAEHRELTAAIEQAQARGFYVGPAVQLNLAQIERELGEVAA